MPTSSVTLSSSWQNIGTGPLYVENVGPGTAHIHFGSTAPAADTADYIGVGAGASRDYGGSDTVYARTFNDAIVKTVS